ncbi:MAG: response regulator [Desulfobacterales bacterium]
MEPKTILIVDDEMDMRFFLATLAETNGYRYLLAKNGGEGLEAAEESHPDLIILDIMMPKEGGVHMYGQLKQSRMLRDIPVIVLSAISRKTFYHYMKMLSVRMGDIIPEPDAYLEKPPEAEEILAVIRSLIP